MARVTGPLMSFDASGTIAGAAVFSKWRGRNYVRRHAVPANPRTSAQLASRAIIAFLGREWALLTAPDQATWEEAADAAKFSPFNQYVKINARNWRDLYAPSQASPAARLLAVPDVDSITAVVSGRQVQLTIALPAITDSWGIVLCRSLSPGFSATPGNAIAIITPAVTSVDYVDGPLAPDTYYYNAFQISTDGNKGNVNTEESAVVA